MGKGIQSESDDRTGKIGVCLMGKRWTGELKKSAPRPITAEHTGDRRPALLTRKAGLLFEINGFFHSPRVSLPSSTHSFSRTVYQDMVDCFERTYRGSEAFQKFTLFNPFSPSICRASAGVAGSMPSSMAMRMILATCSPLLFASTDLSR